MPRRVWLLLTAALAAGFVAIGLIAVRPADPPPLDELITLTGPVPARPQAPAGAPNVVLVIGCTVRRDQTSLHGGPPAVTPFLTALAAQGARFDDVIAAAPWTRAAVTALLTGHHPISVGMADPSPGRDERVLADRVVTLAEHLQAHGWRTAGLTTNPNLNALYGFDQGFDLYRQPALLWREAARRVSGNRAVDEALALLDALPGPATAPFFLQVMLIDAHAPHSATPEELALFSEAGVPERVSRYRASLRRLDDAVARLETGLVERGHDRDDTLFVFTNDHGEGLHWPAHHGASHGRYLTPSSVGGVLVLRGPGVPTGVVFSGLASQVDLAPTLAGLIGVPRFPAPGLDLSAALRGGPSPAVRDRAFTETWFKDVDRAAIYTPDRACQLDLHPRRGGRDRDFPDGCFDRHHDPLHANPSPDDPLTEALRAWRRERAAEAIAFGDVDRAEPDAATRSQLEALGYSE